MVSSCSHPIDSSCSKDKGLVAPVPRRTVAAVASCASRPCRAEVVKVVMEGRKMGVNQPPWASNQDIKDIMCMYILIYIYVYNIYIYICVCVYNIYIYIYILLLLLLLLYTCGYIVLGYRLNGNSRILKWRYRTIFLAGHILFLK